ncbi:hypothetical protein Bbelb_004980, partial [Branchiostoma belcheri]
MRSDPAVSGRTFQTFSLTRWVDAVGVKVTRFATLVDVYQHKVMWKCQAWWAWRVVYSRLPHFEPSTDWAY